MNSAATLGQPFVASSVPVSQPPGVAAHMSWSLLKNREREYIPSHDTDIRETFKRIRETMKETA